jgi:hypothetical protein
MDPQMLPFPTIGHADLLSDLFVELASVVYAKPEMKDRLLKDLIRYPIFTSFNVGYWTVETVPSTLKALVELYFAQPITEKDRTEFMNIYQVPFIGTGKRLKDLYAINPAIFTPVLDALIQSKRIQRIIVQPYTLEKIEFKLQLRKKILRDTALEEYAADSAALKIFLHEKYEQQEVEIAVKTIEAQEKENKLYATEESMKAKIAANAGVRRKRKSRRGGKRSTRKGSSLRRRQ